METNISNYTSHDLSEQLCKASCDGRVDEVERLLARGALVNWRNSIGCTALHIACLNNHPDVVKILAQQENIDVNVLTTSKDTPLHLACYDGYLKCVQLLMATGQCDLGAVTSDGLTSLGLAVREGKLDIIKYLITDCNVDVNGAVGWDGLTPLGVAVSRGKLDTIKYVISEFNVDINGAVTRDGLTPLGVAVREGHLDTITYLIMNYSSMDINDSAQVVRILELTLKDKRDVTTKVNENNRLLLACKFGYTAIVRYLINQCNVDVNRAVTSDGLTPLGVAVREGKLDTIQFLITECNVDVNRAVTRDGLTPLGVAIKEGHLDIIKFLIIKCNVAVNNSAQVTRVLELTLKDKREVTTKMFENNRLLLACKFGYTAIVRYLINQCNVDVNGAVTRDGLTPLGVAVREGHLDTIKYLITVCKLDVNRAVTSDGLTPLGVAVRWGKLDIIKHLISDCNVAVNDAFLIACKYGATKIVDYFLSDVGCDPNIKDEDGNTPLFLAGSKDVIQLLFQHGATAEKAYDYHAKALGNVFSKDSLKNPVKILVIGHGGEGKSTLIEAMEQEPNAFTALVNIFASPKEVDGVSKKTAGIIPRLFKSRVFGEVLVYDFAGQEAYYSSHAAIIKNTVDACRPIIILVIGLHKDDTFTTHSVSYWLGIIANQCSNMEGKAPLIVVGSHADCLTELEQQISKKENIVLQIVSKYPTLDLLKFIPMDNRYCNSSGMKILRNTVGPACASIRSTLAVSLTAHMFLIYLVSKDEIAVSLEKVQRQIKEESSQALSKKHKKVVPFIPKDVPRLVDICVQLNDKGHILFLHNAKSPKKSFIVLKKQELLGKVNGTIFAPEDFDQHCQLSTSTGVVPCSKLAAHLPDLNTDMLTRFLINLEFAVPIEDPEVLRLIKQHRKDAGEPVSPHEKYLFCPALIRLQVDTAIFNHRDNLAYHFGWVMSCSDKDQFLDARFLHVLLLRLSLSLGHAPVIKAHIPSLQQHCSVWKTGVCWGTADGDKVLVEVIDKKKVVVLMQARHLSLNLFQLRSTVMKKVVDTSTELCSTVVIDEAFLPPHSVTYPLEDTHVFDIKSLAKSVIGQNMFVLSIEGVHDIPLSELLQAEVYADLGENILQLLFNPTHKELSDRFISALATCWNKNPRLADIVRTAITENASAAFQECNNLDDVLKVWKSTGDSSGKALRRILDPLSVFAGRNPLELVGVAARETSDDLLQAPRPKASCPSTDSLLVVAGVAPTVQDWSVSERTEVCQTTHTEVESVLTLVALKRRTGVSDTQLDTEVIEHDLHNLAGSFDNVDTYLLKLGLLPGQQTDIKDLAFRKSTQIAMAEALRLWRSPNPLVATFRALLIILLDLKRGDVAVRVCQYIVDRVP